MVAQKSRLLWVEVWVCIIMVHRVSLFPCARRILLSCHHPNHHHHHHLDHDRQHPHLRGCSERPQSGSKALPAKPRRPEPEKHARQHAPSLLLQVRTLTVFFAPSPLPPLPICLLTQGIHDSLFLRLAMFGTCVLAADHCIIICRPLSL